MNANSSNFKWAQRLYTWFIAIVFVINNSHFIFASEEGLNSDARAFFKSYCVKCHGETKRKGNFRIDTLPPDFNNPIVAEKWSEVAFRIKSAEMPPPEEPQPTTQAIGETVDYIVQKVREGTAARMAKRGRFEQYRLSRHEYAHTVYDLLGVVFDVDAPGAFNEDPRWHGFDRVGALLSLAPSHIQRYMEAADKVIGLAFPDEKQVSMKERKIVGEGKRQLLQLGEGWGFRLKSPGYYRLKVRASGLPAFTGRLPHISIWHTQHKRSFDGIDLVAEEDAPTSIEFEGLYPAGNYTIRNHARTVKHANGGISLFRNETIDANQSVTSLTGKHRSPWTKVVDENGLPTMPLLLVDWVEVEGPVTKDDTHTKRQIFFSEKSHTFEERLNRLSRFAEYAWRRPVEDVEISPYAELVDSEIAAGETFNSAYRSALASMLVSRSFFCIQEGAPDENKTHVNDFELACRLSYLLWSSMPDEQLSNEAKQGELHLPSTLALEFERMIRDPKINRFLDSFPKQWLQLHRVGMFQPDPQLYPNYDPLLEESMIQETTYYFKEMFEQDLSVRELVDSNWTVLNPRLALHYDVFQPDCTGFARFRWKDNTSQRGGILTHASVLSLTSDGTRHRPVHRGAWISETMLARTPTPPPPNVDPLEPVTGKKPKQSIRSKLEMHATDPNCVSCHAKIDPLGFAFENYDAIGRWRENENVTDGIGENPAVDASGALPDGSTFDGPDQFKQLLAQDDEKLAAAFLEHLATYALRRVLTIDDRDQLTLVAKKASEDGFRLKSLIRAFVLSDFFRQR